MIYAFSKSEEVFHDHVEAESIDDSRRIAEEELDLREGEPYYVGVREEVRPERYLTADRVLEQVSDSIYDLVGEIAEDWPSATAEQIADLDQRMKRVFRDWLTDTDGWPRFFLVKNAKQFFSGDLDASDPIVAVSTRDASTARRPLITGP